MYEILFAHPLVEAITGWDFADGAWLGAPSGFIRKDNTTKPVYDKIRSMIKDEWWTDITVKTDDNGNVLVSGVRGGSVYAYGHEEYTTADEAGYNDWSNKISTYEGGADIELGGLLDDLGWEFCCELHRRQDLIRFKMTDGRSVWDGKSWFCKDATSTTTYDVYCIPQEAIRANLDLKQNPGY